MSSPFVLTNLNLQNNTVYRGNIDGNWFAAARMIDAFAPSAAPTPNMTVFVDPGYVLSGSTLTQVGRLIVGNTHGTTTVDGLDTTFGLVVGQPVTGQDMAASTTIATINVAAGSITLNNAATGSHTGVALTCGAQVTGVFTAPVTNPRIDRVVVNATSGIISVVAGTPAATPVPTTIPAGTYPVCQVLLQTTSAVITNSMITDERALGAGGGITSITAAIAANGGLTVSGGPATSGSTTFTFSLNVNNLVTKASPVTADLIAIYDVAGAASKNATVSSIIALAPSFPAEVTIAVSAGVADLGAGGSNLCTINSTSTVTSFGNSASTSDPIYIVRFQAGTPITYNSTTMITPGAVSFTTEAEDVAWVKYEGATSKWRFVGYFDALGTAKPWPGGSTIGTNDGNHAISTLTLFSDGRVKAYTNVNLPAGGSSGGGSTCFILTAPVTMADGSKKPLLNVRIGEWVADGVGGKNPVEALDRTTLANRLMFWINREHWTSDEHPHMRPDRTYVAPNVNAIYAEWGKKHPVIIKDGSTEMRLNVGLPEGAVTQMRAGQTLLKESGPVTITSFDIGNATDWPPETALGNLVLGGSGTYVIDGYVVTGWPNHEKFDHAAWKPKT